MLAALIKEFAESAPAVHMLISVQRSWTATEVLALAARWVQVLERRKKNSVVFYLKISPDLVAAIVAASRLGMAVTVVRRCSSLGELRRLHDRFQYDLMVTDADRGLDIPVEAIYASEVAVAGVEPDFDWRTPGEAAGGGSINILTSGTTGEPKNVTYSWDELLAQIPANDRAKRESQRWLLAYNLSHYAGIQVFLHTLLHHNSLVIAPAQDAPSMWSAAIQLGVTHISGTPTFWRIVMAQANAKELHTLKHATLSGEIVTEDVLSRLAALYPDITVSQIYASTELGSLVSVRDRRPGLPIALFEATEAGQAQFRIVDSELQVHTPLGGGGWRPTGDLVQVRDGRVFFIGRKSEVINVGGIKVHPQIVESLVTPVEGVLFARAVGHPNPITGQIVRLDVVLQAGHERESVEAKIRAVCNALENHAKPRQIRYLDSIETNNMKLTRRVS